MTSRAKAAYDAKMRRRSAPPALPLSPPPSPPPNPAYRTGIKVQEIPPKLCHLTGDELATPFPPIALGGYIRYYRAHCQHLESINIWEHGLAKFNLEVKNSMQDAEKRQRASASPRSNLLPPPISSSPPESIPYPPLRRPILSIIHEDSREAMRSETKESASLPIIPYKARVTSHPSTTSTICNKSPSTLTLSLAVSSSPGCSSPPNSPAQVSPPTPGRGALRRRKRQILRTPSVENDFARSAKELFGFEKKDPGLISRANSTGSETTEGEEDTILSSTVSVSTALTSVSDTQSISFTLASSPMTFGKNDRLTDGDHHDYDTSSIIPIPSRHPRKLGSNHNRTPLSSCHLNSDSDESSSPTISTPSTSFTHRGLLAGVELQQFVVLDFDEDEDEDENENEGGGSRESWASYVTAKSYLDPSLPVVVEAD